MTYQQNDLSMKQPFDQMTVRQNDELTKCSGALDFLFGFCGDSDQTLVSCYQHIIRQVSRDQSYKTSFNRNLQMFAIR